jgi:hypothetical protein
VHPVEESALRCTDVRGAVGGVTSSSSRRIPNAGQALSLLSERGSERLGAGTVLPSTTATKTTYSPLLTESLPAFHYI